MGSAAVRLSMTRNIVSASRNGGDRLEKLRLLEWCLSRKPHVDCLLLACRGNWEALLAHQALGLGMGRSASRDPG